VVTHEPIGFVRGIHGEAVVARWDAVESRIELDPTRREKAPAGLDAFSHRVMVYSFHETEPAKTGYEARHPRGSPAQPCRRLQLRNP
jgi:tRNA (Thr-GGU) A37 N-methylase